MRIHPYPDARARRELRTPERHDDRARRLRQAGRGSSRRRSAGPRRKAATSRSLQRVRRPDGDPGREARRVHGPRVAGERRGTGVDAGGVLPSGLRAGLPPKRRGPLHLPRLGRARPVGWQSGLYYADRTAKPSLDGVEGVREGGDRGASASRGRPRDRTYVHVVSKGREGASSRATSTPTIAVRSATPSRPDVLGSTIGRGLCDSRAGSVEHASAGEYRPHLGSSRSLVQERAYRAG